VLLLRLISGETVQEMTNVLTPVQFSICMAHVTDRKRLFHTCVTVCPCAAATHAL